MFETVLFVAAVGTCVAIPALVISAITTNKKLDEIHGLVNDRLTAALAEIRTLRDELVTLKGRE
jgi:hypothetical protein